jgi:hypothetical protein
MDRVNTIGVDVVGKAATASDAGNEHRLLRRDADLGENLLHLGENRIIAASRTPTDILVACKVVWLQERECSAHGGIERGS